MGLKNHPSRDNSIGKDMRKHDNERLPCSAMRCGNYRKGYSKYCLMHKNHIAQTGSLEQEYIRALKTTLKPYVLKVSKQIQQNASTHNEALRLAKSILMNPNTLNSVNVFSEFDDINPYASSLLSSKTLSQLQTIKIDEYTFLASVVAVFIFQKEYPSRLILGVPLFFHLGKHIYSYTGYKKKLSHKNKIYSTRSTPTKNQYINLGTRLYSAFYNLIESFKKYHDKEVSPSVVLHHPTLRVRKTRLEELLEEKEDRVQFVKDQMKINPSITVDMANREIRSIVAHMDALIEEEKRMMK